MKALSFFRYLQYGIYSFCAMVGCNLKWKLMDTYDQCRDEVQKHLDIKFMLDRITFLERSVQTFMGGDKFKAMHLRGKSTFEEAKRNREMYYLRTAIIS
jgi:hypothetical protein